MGDDSFKSFFGSFVFILYIVFGCFGCFYGDGEGVIETFLDCLVADLGRVAVFWLRRIFVFIELDYIEDCWDIGLV